MSREPDRPKTAKFLPATDLEPVKRYAKQRVRDAERALEVEVEQFRNELRARQRA
jgi:hypothetical protein